MYVELQGNLKHFKKAILVLDVHALSTGVSLCNVHVLLYVYVLCIHWPLLGCLQLYRPM